MNLSPTQFKNRNLVSSVISALSASGLASHRLELEITESVLLQDTQSTLAALHKLHEAGVRISMDDFGTGYSSLSYLRRFPFDKIKIDQSFVRELASQGDSIAIIRAVAALGRSLGIITIAEGVGDKRATFASPFGRMYPGARLSLQCAAAGHRSRENAIREEAARSCVNPQ